VEAWRPIATRDESKICASAHACQADCFRVYELANLVDGGDASQSLRLVLPNVARYHFDGFGRVVLPSALERKFPNAATECRWQFVFPAGRICRNPRFGRPSRFHLPNQRFNGHLPRQHARQG
jgi:hypothetical protein